MTQQDPVALNKNLLGSKIYEQKKNFSFLISFVIGRLLVIHEYTPIQPTFTYEIADLQYSGDTKIRRHL